MNIGSITHFFPGSKENKPQAAIVLDLNDDGTMTLLSFDHQGRSQTRYNVAAESTAEPSAAKPHVIKPQA